ncbi:hypothetical protein [Streptomyces chrestomyceticus]|uniref:hypothetical protein n=1 Tax=Streptomyces chrestomyceticus TaxID=68185 RepID=UPI0033EE237B
MLVGLLLCGHCHQTMTASSKTAAYQCPAGCVSLAAAQATDRVGTVLTARLFARGVGPQARPRPGNDPRRRHRHGPPPARQCPPRLHQWRHSLTETVRRGFATEQIAAITVTPGPAPTQDLTVLWRDSTRTAA